MKKILLSYLFFMLVMTMGYAQSPEKFSYQAVVRDASGNLVSNSPVGVRVSILKNSASGVSVYCETHHLNTNINGLLTMEIGGGTLVGGDFSMIQWGDGPYFLKMETDVTGGTNYTITATQQLLSVPYALYAKYAENGGSDGGDTTGMASILARLIQLERPAVRTVATSNIMSQSAEVYITLFYYGGDWISSWGVCFGTAPNPTLTDGVIQANMEYAEYGSGAVQLSGLTANTTYYVRAYATNSRGTAYGNELSFTTVATTANQPCPGAATVTDIDNNIYNTVQIGNQCWMKENLRATHYTNGISIPLGSNTSTSTGYRYYPDNNSSNVNTYGYLYNWKAVMNNSSSSSSNPSGVQGICPTGWHVPSFSEWVQLANYVGSQSQFVCNNDNSYIAKALASSSLWETDLDNVVCAIGNNPSANNATGFSAIPAGYYSGFLCYIGYDTYFWSSTYNVAGADNFYLSYNSPYWGTIDDNISYGLSVRCLRD